MAARPVLSNSVARRIFLDRHGLAAAPTGPARGDDLLGVIRDLGFVQSTASTPSSVPIT